MSICQNHTSCKNWQCISFNINLTIQPYNLLTDRQLGFRSQHSNLIALTNVIEGIGNSVDNAMITFLVLLDHSNAFDTVHHSIMCFKLCRMLNSSTTAVGLISPCLIDRWQYLSNKELLSNLLHVTRYVRQGSVLSALLYSIYANDMTKQPKHSRIQMYADNV